MSPVDGPVDASDLEASTQKFHFIGGRMRQVREYLKLTQQELADRLGVSKRGIQDNETRNRVPGGEVINGFIGLGINANWLLTGEGGMLLPGSTAGGNQNAAEYNRETVSAQSQAQYMTAPEPLTSRIDGPLLRLCWGACEVVHADAFAAANRFLQLEYAVDLYNLLQRLAANGGMEQFGRLDVGDLAQQLRIFIKLGRARRFNSGVVG